LRKDRKKEECRRSDSLHPYLLSVGMLDGDILLSLSKSDSLGDSHAQALLHAAVTEAATVVSVLAVLAVESDAMGVTLLGIGKGNDGGENLGMVVIMVLLTLLALTMDAEASILRSIDVAGEELCITLRIHQLNTICELECDNGGVVGDVG